MILLHITAAGDALKEGKTISTDYSIRRLSEASSAMGKAIARQGRHFVDCVQAPLPTSFIPLLLVNGNEFTHTPESLGANQKLLEALEHLRDEKRAFTDSNASVSHKVCPLLVVDDTFHSSIISSATDKQHPVIDRWPGIWTATGPGPQPIPA